MEWKKLKKYLLETHEEYKERNGLPFCKNCGIDHTELVKDIDQILLQSRKEWIERIREYLEDHEQDTKPWKSYDGKELKRIIEKDILSLLEESGEKI